MTLVAIVWGEKCGGKWRNVGTLINTHSYLFSDVCNGLENANDKRFIIILWTSKWVGGGGDGGSASGFADRVAI